MGVNVGRDPLIHIRKLGLAETAGAGHQIALVFFRATRILEMDRLQVVLVGVAAGENAQGVAAVIAVGSIFERTPELAVVGANFFPVALEVAEKIVGAGKTAVADLAHVGPGCGFQVGGLVGGQVGEVEVTLRALALFARLPLFAGVGRRLRLGRGVGCGVRGRHGGAGRRGRRLRLDCQHRNHGRRRFGQLILHRHRRRQGAWACREHGCGCQGRESCSGIGRRACKRRRMGRERRPSRRARAVLAGHQVGEQLVQLRLEMWRR